MREWQKRSLPPPTLVFHPILLCCFMLLLYLILSVVFFLCSFFSAKLSRGRLPFVLEREDLMKGQANKKIHQPRGHPLGLFYFYFKIIVLLDIHVDMPVPTCMVREVIRTAANAFFFIVLFLFLHLLR